MDNFRKLPSTFNNFCFFVSHFFVFWCLFSLLGVSVVGGCFFCLLSCVMLLLVVEVIQLVPDCWVLSVDYQCLLFFHCAPSLSCREYAEDIQVILVAVIKMVKEGRSTGRQTCITIQYLEYTCTQKIFQNLKKISPEHKSPSCLVCCSVTQSKQQEGFHSWSCQAPV